jgi:hypothetical protein
MFYMGGIEPMGQCMNKTIHLSFTILTVLALVFSPRLDVVYAVSPSSWFQMIDVLWDATGGCVSPHSTSIALLNDESMYIVGAASKYHNWTTYEDFIFMSKLRGDGRLAWFKSIGEGASMHYYVSDAEVDSDGNIYLTGGLGPSGESSSQAFVAKMDAYGNPLWFKTLSVGRCNFGDRLAVDGLGNVYVVGRVVLQSLDCRSFIAKISPKGVLQWFREFDVFGVRGVFIDSEGVYVYGSSGGDAFITKLDYDGDVKWSKAIGGAYWESVHTATVDAYGNIYLTGNLYTPSNFTKPLYMFIAKLDSEANPIWVKAFNLESVDVFVSGVDVDLGMNVYIAGIIYEDAYKCRGLIGKLDANGNALWFRLIGFMGGIHVDDMVVDGSGNVYLCGLLWYPRNGIFVSKLADGHLSQRDPEDLTWVDGSGWEPVCIDPLQLTAMGYMVDVNSTSITVKPPTATPLNVSSLSLASVSRSPETHLAVKESPTTLITLHTSSLSYSPEDTVSISGSVYKGATPVSNVQVVVEIYDPSGEIRLIDVPSTAADGSFNVRFRLPSTWPSGTYVVRAIYADVTSTVSFIVVGGADLKEAYKKLTEYYNSLRKQYEELNQTLQETNARLREAEASLQTVEAELTLTKMELEEARSQLTTWQTMTAIAFILGLTIGATTTYVTLRRRRRRIREGG